MTLLCDVIGFCHSIYMLLIIRIWASESSLILKTLIQQFIRDSLLGSLMISTWTHLSSFPILVKCSWCSRFLQTVPGAGLRSSVGCPGGACSQTLHAPTLVGAVFSSIVYTNWNVVRHLEVIHWYRVWSMKLAKEGKKTINNWIDLT